MTYAGWRESMLRNHTMQSPDCVIVGAANGAEFADHAGYGVGVRAIGRHTWYRAWRCNNGRVMAKIMPQMIARISARRSKKTRKTAETVLPKMTINNLASTTATTVSSTITSPKKTPSNAAAQIIVGHTAIRQSAHVQPLASKCTSPTTGFKHRTTPQWRILHA